MKKRKTSLIFLAIFLLSANFCSADSLSPLAKKRALADLNAIKNVFEVKYAPLRWKEEYARWNLDLAIEDARMKISQESVKTIKDCQVILRDFFNSTRDYHAGIRFYSTETATLPFLVKGTQGRYFVVHVDRENEGSKDFPFEVGDEILKVDGRPVHDVIQEIRVKELGQNVLETDQALAEMLLTHRRGDLGHTIPSGKVVLTGKKRKSAKETEVSLEWAYTPERIRDFSKINMNVYANHQEWSRDWKTALKKSQFFDKFMMPYFWNKSFVGRALDTNKHALGSKVSFVPPLGQKLWKAEKDALFDAYIFKSPAGKNIGYVRIPHYIGDAEEVEEFGTLMAVFEKKCQALIIDQINNPGGSVFYLYGLVSTLTNKPMHAPKHHIALTQEEVYTAAELLPVLEQISTDAEAKDTLGEEMGGYHVDYEFVEVTKRFCHFLIKAWENGNFYTDLTYLFGIDMIKPHPKYRFTKPILLLVNSLDFSAADFFAAIMQDGERALLLGSRTSGAGGYVVSTHFPNQTGISGFSLTGSLAKRIDQKPIENLGVTPDVEYELTVNDLQDNYKDYVSIILKTVDNMLQKPNGVK